MLTYSTTFLKDFIQDDFRIQKRTKSFTRNHRKLMRCTLFKKALLELATVFWGLVLKTDCNPGHTNSAKRNWDRK